MINQKLVSQALLNVNTSDFELFSQTFYGSLQDREFVPLGGMHDGGAEGFDETEVVEPEIFRDTEYKHFLQVSKEETVRSKVRKTVKRLRAYGREPTVLTYISSKTIPDIDKEQQLLSKELQCQIRIRDARFIETNINSTSAIQGAFHSYLEPCIAHLFRPGAVEAPPETSTYTDRTLAVFLRQEVDNRRDKSGLLESVADSLVIWSLGDTDPDKDIFLTRQEIQNLIEETLPAAKHFIRGILDIRLATLAAKDAPNGRQIRWYKKDDKFCLPYETRVLVATDNAEDDQLRAKVTKIFEERIETLATDQEITAIKNSIVFICHSTLEKSFEKQGLEVAQFTSNGMKDDELYTDVAAILAAVVDRLDNTPEEKHEIRRLGLSVLRGTFYKSTDEERLYLQKLSRTYVLLLMLRNEPRIVEYFRSIAKSFRLYVGTDLIIRALSEQYLSPENRTTVNLLNILRDAGSELILTQTTVEEVSTHLRAQILEFENFYTRIENKLTSNLVEYIDRILIRSYFYSRLSQAEGVTAPDNWHAYISQFATYEDLRSKKAETELARYLLAKFRMVYEAKEQSLKGIDEEELSSLQEAILKLKREGGRHKQEDATLAYNDALHTLRVYQRRLEEGENSPGNPFGFQTWWLTQDGKVRRAGAEASSKRGGARSMMRPEFLLNYISLAPDLKQVRDSYLKIFPTLLGIRLSARLADNVFSEVLRKASEVAAYDDARAGAMISSLTEKLKADSVRQYENKWSEVTVQE